MGPSKRRFKPAPRVANEKFLIAPYQVHQRQKNILRANGVSLKDYNRIVEMRSKLAPAKSGPKIIRGPSIVLEEKDISPRGIVTIPGTYGRRCRETPLWMTPCNAGEEISFVHNGVLKSLAGRRHASDARRMKSIDDQKPAGIVSENAYRRPMRQQMCRSVGERRLRWSTSSDEIYACFGREVS